MSFSIAGKTAIVTGAGRGIGLAIARHLIDRGANVMCADPDEAALARELGEEAQDEGTVRLYSGNLCEKLGVANLMSATLASFDRVDILVNAQRVILPSDPLGIEPDAMEEMMAGNLMTSLRLSQAVARRMIAQSQAAREAGGDASAEGSCGAIVNISSIAARLAQPELMAYSIACAALEQMTRSMAVALAPRRIRVNAVAFGSVMSASLQSSLKGQSEKRQEITRHTPMGRIAAPGELAEAVQFLLSDGAGFITGQVLTVDGGRSLLDPVCVPAH